LPTGCDVSTGLLPVTSSNNSTPNEYTSDLSVSFPLDAYSGAKYLNIETNVQKFQTAILTRNWSKFRFNITKRAYQENTT
jgi:hypothetical protein